MFNDSVGANQCYKLSIICEDLPILRWGLDSLEDRSYLDKIALIMMQGWLRFPLPLRLDFGILQSIPNDLYEAAYIDGANGWQKFRNITFPNDLAVCSTNLDQSIYLQL